MINKQIDFQQLFNSHYFEVGFGYNRIYLSWEISKANKKTEQKKRQITEGKSILKCHQFILLKKWNLIISNYKFFLPHVCCSFPASLIVTFNFNSIQKQLIWNFPNENQSKFEFNFQFDLIFNGSMGKW